MPSTPYIIVPRERYRLVVEFVRPRCETANLAHWSREDVYRYILAEVAAQTETGAWSRWSAMEIETAVAVAQRVAASLLWPVEKWVTW